MHEQRQQREPWEVSNVELRVGESRVTVSVGWAKGTKYLFLRSSQSWNDDEREMFQTVKDLSLKVAKAWAAKDAFSEFWSFRNRGQAMAFFNNWRRWVGRLKLGPLTKA